MPPNNLPGGIPGSNIPSKSPSPSSTTTTPRASSPLKIKAAAKIPESNGGGNFSKFVGFFGVFVLFAAVLWYLFGGGTSQNKNDEAGLPSETVGTSTSRVEVPIAPLSPKDLKPSLYAGWVKLSAGTAAKEVYPEKEYVQIDITQKNLSSVDISNWKLMNAAGASAALDSGGGGEIRVKGSDTLIVSTGVSPAGESFQVNKCSGFLEQFSDFIPELQKKCPSVSSLPSYKTLEQPCKNFIQTLPVCETNTKPYPEELSGSCRHSIGIMIGYNACVANHKSDTDFATNEWRIFLSRPEELWAAKDEIIMLLDAEGKLIASAKY